MMRQSLLLWVCVIAFLPSVSCTTDGAARKEKAEVSRRLGEGYLAEGNISAALGELLEAEKSYDKDPYLQYDLGLAYFAKQEFKLAISHFDKAVALKPDYSEALNAKGTVYLNLERWDEAISCFTKVRDDLLYATPYITFNNLGEAYRGKKEYERAISFYKKALKENPRFANAHRGIGLAYMEMGDYEAAVSSLEKAIGYAPRFAAAHYDLGRAYAVQYNTEKAVSAFQRVAALVPDTPLANRALTEIKKLQRE